MLSRRPSPSSRRTVALLLALAVLSVSTGTTTGAAASRGSAPDAPTHLTVGDRERPLAVEGPPQFGWWPQDSDGNEIQTAYQLRVLRADGAEQWDSGKVRSAEQQYVAYAGPALASGTAYRWTVRTWDRAGRVSPWAPPATFETGLTDQDWEGAAWIRRLSTEPDDYTLARKEVAIPRGRVVRARAYVSAYHQYRLYLNGAEVDDGPAFSYPGEGYYQATDVTQQLQAGRHLAIGVLYHWYGGGQGRPAANDHRGMLLKLVVEYADGRRQVVVSDGSWRVRRASHFETGAPRRNSDAGDYTERIDARQEPVGWDKPGYDDSVVPWVAATVAAPTEMPRLTGQEPRLVKTVKRPVSVRRFADGTVVADFGVVVPARPVIRFAHGVSGRVVDIQTSYNLTPDGHASTGRTDTQGSDLTMRYTQRAGRQRVEANLHWGWRYLEIKAPGEVLGAGDIAAIVEHTDVDREARFVSSDRTLNEVWELLRRSALYSVQHQFVDTPTREKGQFLGDAVDISYATMAALGERDATQKAIREFLHSQDRYWSTGNDLGRYNAVYPNGDGKRDIPDYSEMFVNWVWRYWLETGDTALVRQAYPYLRNTADYVTRHIPATGPTAGLVTNLSGGSGPYQYGIVDWPAAGRFGYDMDTAARTTINVQGYDVLRRTADLAAALGRPAAEISAYGVPAERLRDAINAKLRRSDGVYIDGLYADGRQSTHAGQHSTSYAIAFRVAPAADFPQLAEYLAGLGMKQGPMTAHWLLQALADAGRADAVLTRLTDPDDLGWANVLARGGTFLWEQWNPVNDESYSHGWGAQAAVDVLGTILGVTLAAPGAARLSVTVPDIDLEFAQGTVPTQRGPVTVEWRRRPAGGVRAEVELPVNVTATVSLPAPGNLRYDADGPGHARYLGHKNGRAHYEVGSGATTFTVRYDR
ncbi:alpha-L-rhamnosidase domain protein [Kribbella flavida DSM 17836]|uniref:alpha-L-rhamnosidase n=1 Tax=Kribbella flavida (strain DSM 17836 / JCM 10339 / NBRC 14399) TaxID=479435 RepID=D2PKD6_KRIFD|nr:alpha-L-rhamnosidase N-terminal domain-containing protein [Kribbella flavida]ADB30448.1 alpha-L-rhamnosidase domain protein [Kribbella flavida DSM 17836]